MGSCGETNEGLLIIEGCITGLQRLSRGFPRLIITTWLQATACFIQVLLGSRTLRFSICLSPGSTEEAVPVWVLFKVSSGSIQPSPPWGAPEGQPHLFGVGTGCLPIPKPLLVLAGLGDQSGSCKCLPAAFPPQQPACLCFPRRLLLSVSSQLLGLQLLRVKPFR